jgi:hypothetical protein
MNIFSLYINFFTWSNWLLCDMWGPHYLTSKNVHFLCDKFYVNLIEKWYAALVFDLSMIPFLNSKIATSIISKTHPSIWTSIRETWCTLCMYNDNHPPPPTFWRRKRPKRTWSQALHSEVLRHLWYFRVGYKPLEWSRDHLVLREMYFKHI